MPAWRLLPAVLGRERAKDTTLDYGEPDPIAAYAEIRPLSPSGIFDGLDLGAEPPRLKAETTPLMQAPATLLAAMNARDGMTRRGLPVLPHHEASVGAAVDQFEALRPGSVGDLNEVIARRPDLFNQALAGPGGLVSLLAAIQRRPADRRAEQEAEARRIAEEAARRAEHAALAPARARLLQERMARWWQTKYPYGRMSDYSFDARQAEAKEVERGLRLEIETLPVADLRRIAAKLERADRQAEQEAVARPRPGPSPRPF